MGRFLTPDPYRANNRGAGDPANPQSWNRYSYVLNDPVSYYDPHGLEAWCPPSWHVVGGGESWGCLPDPGPWPDAAPIKGPGEQRPNPTPIGADSLLLTYFSAIYALRDPKCAALFNTDAKKADNYNPSAVLASMIFGGNYGYFGDVQNARIPDLSVAAITVADPATRVSTGNGGVQAASANIYLQNNRMSDFYFLKQTPQNLATTLIHELGHVFNEVDVLGGSKIEYDVDPFSPDGKPNDDAQKRNAERLKDCNPQ